MRWVLSPPSPMGFHYVIICTGGFAAARLSCHGVGRSPKTEPPAIHRAALRALKFSEPAVRGKTMGACERMRAEFFSRDSR